MKFMLKMGSVVLRVWLQAQMMTVCTRVTVVWRHSCCPMRHQCPIAPLHTYLPPPLQVQNATDVTLANIDAHHAYRNGLSVIDVAGLVVAGGGGDFHQTNASLSLAITSLTLMYQSASGIMRTGTVGPTVLTDVASINSRGSFINTDPFWAICSRAYK